MQGGDTDRVKYGDADYSIQCLECGNFFEAKRSDATFCKPSCRVRYSRRPAKLQNAIDSLSWYGKDAINIAGRYPTNKRVETALIALKAQIERALAEMQVENSAV